MKNLLVTDSNSGSFKWRNLTAFCSSLLF